MHHEPLPDLEYIDIKIASSISAGSLLLLFMLGIAVFIVVIAIKRKKREANMHRGKKQINLLFNEIMIECTI